MQYSTAFSDAVLALACLGCLLWLRPAFAGQPVRRALQLGFGLTATAALCGSVRYGLDPNWVDKHRSFTLLSAVLGLPLLGLAALALARGQHWGRPIWTTCLLVLVGLFIGARMLGVEAGYRLALSLTTLLLILYAGLSQWPLSQTTLAALGVVGLFLVAGLVVGTEGFIGPLRRVDLFHALLTPAYPLLAWLLLRLRAAAEEKIPVKTL